MIEHSPNQGRAWRGTRITALLAERLAVPVALDDDARLGALGEALLGAGRGADPLVYVTVSSGIGSGIVSGGRMLRGAHGLAGEVGHLVVDPDGPRCACGRRGDVESYAGGAALARRARRAWPSGRLADGSAAPRDAAGIFRAARAGDPLARGIVAEAAEALGRGLAALATAIDPERIVVGGSLALSQGALVRRAVAIARRRCLAETGRRLVVVQSALGETSVLAGAALLAAELAGGAPPPGP
ncbi:MAG: hypothetical protein A2X23_12010 [Chloroflexi bacterium GWC2_73_18]|nr:MAG: hypothetical protein A2X23_12010 [Chloroflexi bacterium GWC2_73_18]